MAIRQDPIDRAARRARAQLDALVRDLVHARHSAGLTQARVARALHVSRPLVASWERGRILPGPIQLGEWAAAVGLDVPSRAYPGGPALRDAGQLTVLRRFRERVGPAWGWRTEVSVSADPADRRAIDAMLVREGARVGVEAISRLVDSQGQTRPILLKQEAARLQRLVLVLADTRLNRRAVADGDPTLAPAFPCPAREAMRALRRGEAPSGNAIALV